MDKQILWIEKSKKRSDYLLKESPNDPATIALFEAAKKGAVGVFLVTKGHRPMFLKYYKYGFNYFMFYMKGPRSVASGINVATICRLANVDPLYVQDIFGFFRIDDLHREIHKSLKYSRMSKYDQMRKHDRRIRRIINQRLQLITNLFPFPEVKWLRELPGENDEQFSKIGIFKPRPQFFKEEEIRALCQISKAFTKSIDRHHKRHSQ